VSCPRAGPVGVTRRSTYVQELLSVRCRLFTRDIHIKINVISNIVSSSGLKLMVVLMVKFRFGGVSGSLRFRAPAAADASVGFIVGSVRLAYSLSLLGSFVLSACVVDSE